MRPTLFEFAGGDAAFLRLAAAHHARCLADPELNHPFSHADLNPQHVVRLAAYWAEVLGGPPGGGGGGGGRRATRRSAPTSRPCSGCTRATARWATSASGSSSVSW